MGQRILIERTKVLDKIYIQYGVKFTYLNYAYNFYQLQDDQDIKTFEINKKLELEKKIEDSNKQPELTTEQIAIIDEEVEKISEVKLEPNSVLTIDQLIKVQAAMARSNFKIK